MDRILQEDVNSITDSKYIPWDELEGKTILISGGTGIIGYTLIHCLLYKLKYTRLIIITRSTKKAMERFRDADEGRIVYLENSIEELLDVKDNVDYIIHGAADTSSKHFVENPVECFNTIVNGVKSILEIAKNKQVKSVVFLSSMEVYGYPPNNHKVYEKDQCHLISSEVRNVYPIAKIAAESLCYAYYSEFNVPVKTIRLTQTFGPGVDYRDNRVFAEFARCVLEKKNIVLKTEGKTKRSYLYTADATSAILTVLTMGTNGEIYNAANESTFCSIKQMAEMIAEDYGLNVEYDLQPNSNNGYANELYMDLDTTKLRNLGWSVGYDTKSLNGMFARMIEWLSKNKRGITN